MAQAVVYFTVERLGELLISEAEYLCGVSNQIDEIQCELKRMRCFLKEADNKQNQDGRVRQWVSEMRELAFKTEDVIETFALEVTKKQKSGFKDILQRFACMLCEGVSCHNIATEIDDIKAKLNTLTARLPTYGIAGLETSNSLVNSKSPRIFYSHDVEKDFVGMETEIKQLISVLKRNETGWEAVSICGMGGQGKTTIAQKLYNHAEVKACFDVFAWVCVTQQFDREKVLKGLLKQLLPADREGEVSTMEDAKLVKELYQVQQEKNCLIVIDDIWTVESWRQIKSAFPMGETTSGSKILLTTRNETIAAKTGSVHKIEGLTEDEGWKLLSKKAGINDISEKGVSSEKERIGRNMVNRCQGLPLAISSLGGLLIGKSLRDWDMINKDIPFHLANDDEYYTVRQILGLSYDSLPSHLRHCFLCFANYEEDEVIWTEELYVFWIAESLISVEDKAEGETMLDVAERYLDELAHLSLVQIEANEKEGFLWSKYTRCRVHDLIRDLCLSKVKEEKVINVITSQRKPEYESKAIVRRLCIRSNDDWDESMLKPYDQQVISHIRSLSIWKDHKTSEVLGVWPDKIISLKKFRLLRVLTVMGYKFTKKNIRSISELVYLKYLCIINCEVEELPSSIGNLRNLETLDLRVSYGSSIRIQNVVWKLKRLKHLYLPFFIEGGRDEKLRLQGLNELEYIYNYDSKYCDVHDLLQLPKLKVFHGDIIVEDNQLRAKKIIDFIKSRKLRYSDLDIKGEGICCLVLLLECCFIDELRIFTRICKFPEEYDFTHFSRRLTMLWLENSRMEEDPMILLEKLPNLRDLNLRTDTYLGEEMVCTAMGFPQLQLLSLSKLPNLRKLRVDEGAMPNLSKLTIRRCNELEMVPQGLRYLTALTILNFFDMPTAFTNRIKIIDGVKGEDFYEVQHIPYGIRLES